VGGKELNPTYHYLADHSESVQVHFNPNIISYNNLLDIFFNAHNCYGASYSRQYRSAVFYHSAEQETLALYFKQNLEKDGKVKTAIEPATKFYPAEDYHQKYQLQSYKDVINALKLSSYENLKHSPVLSKLNGFVAGHGDPDRIKREISELEISESLKQQLLRSALRNRY